MTYPENDTDFKDYKIRLVNKDSNGDYFISCHEGAGLYTGQDCPIVPVVGQMARFYGDIPPCRGLFINGKKIWYRTKDEQKEAAENQKYGKDAKDWLKDWDEGRDVWSIRMSNLGPGYEQRIHITAAEIIRWWLINSDFSAVGRDLMEKAVIKVPAVKQLNLSGAQWEAAHNLAWRLYQDGPCSVMKDERVKDLHIQVSKNFPGSMAAMPVGWEGAAKINK